ncbi:hypothetical protein ACNAN0_05970 [Agrilactobacillus fermenti]
MTRTTGIVRSATLAFVQKLGAKNAAEELEQKLKMGFDPSLNDITFADYFLEWINRYKIGKYSHDTEQSYQIAERL